VAARLGRADDVLGAHVRRRARDDDVDAVVVEELVVAPVLTRLHAVRLHQPGRLARRAVVDSDDLRERMVTERLHVFARDPAGAEDANAVLRHSLASLFLPPGPLAAIVSNG
jgi:hypothetical protein